MGNKWIRDYALAGWISSSVSRILAHPTLVLSSWIPRGPQHTFTEMDT